MLPLWREAASGVRVVQLSEAEDVDEVEPLVRLFERAAEREGWQPEGALRRWPERSLYFALEVAGNVTSSLILRSTRNHLAEAARAAFISRLMYLKVVILGLMVPRWPLPAQKVRCSVIIVYMRGIPGTTNGCPQSSAASYMIALKPGAIS